MTQCLPVSQNGVASRLDVERFVVYAEPELSATPYFQRGICFQPECSKPFQPKRDWQVFCCVECERKAAAEYRRIGHMLALPMLVHRMGKYEREDSGVINLTRAARRYTTLVQSQWLYDRNLRREGVTNA